MKQCFCDNCGMEFEVQKFDEEKDTMRDGTPVKVLSFTCPKCDEKYIVSVFNNEVNDLRNEWLHAKQLYEDSNSHEDKREMIFCKKKLNSYSHKLKRKYIKEMKHRG